MAIGAASNALGTINDVAEAARLAHDAGALVFVDAVHYAPHRLVDVRAMGCDFLACSAYKFYGPHVGVLYGRRDLLRTLDVPKLEPAPDTAPERLETGTQNHEGIAGAAAAVEFLASLAPGGSRRERLRALYAELDRARSRLGARLCEGLGVIPGRARSSVRPPATARTPTVAFTLGVRHPDAVADALAEEAVFASTGDFYATSVVRRYGLASRGGLSAQGAGLLHGERGGSVAGGRRAFRPGPLRLSYGLDRHHDLGRLPVEIEMLHLARCGVRYDREGLHRLGELLHLHLAAPDFLGLHLLGVGALVAPLAGAAVHDDLPLLLAGHRIDRVLPRRRPSPRRCPERPA